MSPLESVSSPSAGVIRDAVQAACVRPRLLDLFCCGGAASVGYARAGWDVSGVDVADQPDYPFPFTRADWADVSLAGFDWVAASPPCQRYSSITPEWARDQWPDLLDPVRQRLRQAVRDGEIRGYTIENVEGARSLMRSPVMVCGSAFGLGVQRHRLFESSHVLAGTGCAHVGETIPVYGSEPPQGVAAARSAMGVDWLPWSRLVEAIPPDYTEYLGRQMMRHYVQAASVTDSAADLSSLSRSFRRAAPAQSVTGSDRDSSSAPGGFCRHCGEPVERAETGRWRRYCDQSCRQAAFRARRSA